MNNSNTSELEKSSIADRLELTALVVEELVEAGLRVITANAGNDAIDDYVLFSGNIYKFRSWAKSRCLDIEFRLSNPSRVLKWIIKTKYCGVEVRSFISDDEKEEYEHEE